MKQSTKPLFRVALLHEMPMMYGGVPTRYPAGDLFDVLEVKQLPKLDKPFYVLKSVKWGVTIQGYVNSEDFQKVTE